MAGEACTNDTNSVDLSFNGSAELEADVRLRGIADGSLTEDANGIGVALYSAGGLQATASGASLKVGQGLHVGAEGLIKTTGYASSGSVFPANATAPNTTLLRGVNQQFGATLSLTGSLASNEVASVVAAHARWRGRWTTNLTSFGGDIRDSVFAYLQLNLNSAGWVSVDQTSLEYANMSGGYVLDAWFAVAMSNGTSTNLQARLLAGGGTASGTGNQGILFTEFGILEWFY
jgi:hypothetical protein